LYAIVCFCAQFCAFYDSFIIIYITLVYTTSTKPQTLNIVLSKCRPHDCNGV